MLHTLLLFVVDGTYMLICKTLYCGANEIKQNYKIQQQIAYIV